MKVLVAPDSFKENLTARQVGAAIEKGILRADERIRVTVCPLADGGEGTVDALLAAHGGRRARATVHGPLMRKVRASYGIFTNGRNAVIEMAAASGLGLVPSGRRNPLKTTTFGTGELIGHALKKGVQNIIIGIGGSATVDGGVGMARALGVKFLDTKGREVKRVGDSLAKIKRIDVSGLDKRVKKAKIYAASDVENPLLGKQGAARVFGPQKGAHRAQVALLEKGLANLAGVIRKDLGVNVKSMPGGGAAGGLGAGLAAFLGATLCEGVELICDAVDIDGLIRRHDIVVVAEGRMDEQSLFGKTPVGVARRAKRLKKPVVAVCGGVAARATALREAGIDAAFSIAPGIVTREEAFSNAKANIARFAEELFGALRAAGK